MNETLAVIERRRSIRKYKPEQITNSELEAVLEAAIWAPNEGSGDLINPNSGDMQIRGFHQGSCRINVI